MKLIENCQKVILQTVGVVLTTTLLMGFTGCDAIASLGFNADDVYDVVAQYLDYVKDTKYSKAAGLVDGGSDAFKKLKLSDYEEDVLDILVATTEYEISEGKGQKGKSATCELLLESASLKDALKKSEDNEVDSIKKALKKASTREESFTIELTYEDDEWLITDVSDIVEFYTHDFSKLEAPEVIENDDDTAPVTSKEFSSNDAIAYFEEQRKGFNEYSLKDIYELMIEPNDSSMTYEEFTQSEDAMIYQFLVTVMKNTVIDYEVYDISNDEVVLTITAQIPDMNEMPKYFLESPTIIELMANAICDSEFEFGTEENNKLIGAMIDYIKDHPPVKFFYTSTSIKLNADGEYEDDGGLDEIIGELVTASSFGDTFLMDADFLQKVADYAYENGMCDQIFYAALCYEVSLIRDFMVIEPGSDFQSLTCYEDPDFTFEAKYYKEGDPGMYIVFETVDRHSAYDKFKIDVVFEGESIYSGTGYCGKDRNNEMTLTLNGPLQAGEYDITITGFDGETFANLHIVVTK